LSISDFEISAPPSHRTAQREGGAFLVSCYGIDMRMTPAPSSIRADGRIATAALAFLLVWATSTAVESQELVPAAYTPAPYGINLLSLVSAYNTGDLAFDPSGPIEDASGRITISALAYARTVNITGRSANVAISVPYVTGHLEGLYYGEEAFADRSGFGDVGVRLAVNLFGAPAMRPQEFRSYRPRTLIGVSLSVKAPTGQYDSAKLINIGTNRWAFKPEIGFVRVMGRWAVDVYVGEWFFTDNTDFFGGLRREQDPILSTQAHLRYAFGPRVWAALDANFWRGGQTTIAGVEGDDLQRNSRVGVTCAWRVGRSHSLRFAASRGAITRIGGDFDSIGMSYGYSWAGNP